MSNEGNSDKESEFTLPALVVTAPRFTWNDTFGIKIKSISERIFEYLLGPQNPAFIHATLNHQDIRNGYTLAYNPNGILWRINAAGDPHPDDLYQFYQQQEIHQAYADNLSAKFTMIFGTPIARSNAEVVGARLSQGPSRAVFKTGQTTVQDIAANPKALSGKSAEEIAQMLRDAGYDVTVEASKKSTSGAQIIKINNPGEGRNITQVQVSPGGGRHGANPYVKISTSDQGIVKVVDGAGELYKTDGAETAKIIFTGGK